MKEYDILPSPDISIATRKRILNDAAAKGWVLHSVLQYQGHFLMEREKVADANVEPVLTPREAREKIVVVAPDPVPPGSLKPAMVRDKPADAPPYGLKELTPTSPLTAPEKPEAQDLPWETTPAKAPEPLKPELPKKFAPPFKKRG